MMNVEENFERVQRVAQKIRETFDPVPEIGLVLGSGLGGLADALDAPRVLPFEELPGYPKAKIAGHAGQLSAGRLEGVDVLLQQGRVHYYEGHPMETVVLLTRGLALAGVKILIITNAAGGIATDLGPGDLMRLTDHLNLMGNNPLIGPHEPRFGERFPDLSRTYSDVGAVLDRAAKQTGQMLHKGVYAGFSGPSYETPAEIEMVRALGASAVGMSTVPEAIAATQMGVKVGAVSCIANSAAGMTEAGISHEEVLEVTARASRRLTAILIAALPMLQKLIGEE